MLYWKQNHVWCSTTTALQKPAEAHQGGACCCNQSLKHSALRLRENSLQLCAPCGCWVAGTARCTDATSLTPRETCCPSWQPDACIYPFPATGASDFTRNKKNVLLPFCSLIACLVVPFEEINQKPVREVCLILLLVPCNMAERLEGE